MAQSLDIREEHFCNHMRYAHHRIRAALNQPSLHKCNVCIHAVSFVVSSIHAASFKPLHLLSCTRTLLYSRRCIDAAAARRCIDAAAAQHPEAVMQKKPKDPREGGTVRLCIEI